MFSLFKKDKSKPVVPQWASFFNQDEYDKFAEAIHYYFYEKNITYIMCDGMIETGQNDFGFTNLGLTNVAQVCKQDKKSNYKKRVAEHFEALLRTNLFDKEFKKNINNYEQIKRYIGVRLYHTEYMEVVGRDLTIGKDFAGDVYAMLVFDLPDAVTNVTREQAAQWEKTDDELMETGIQNIKNKYSFHIAEEDLGEFKIWFVLGDHFFTPNIVFDLQNHPKLIGAKGSLIGIPHRHAAVVYPINNLDVVSTITQLIPVIYGMNQEGPGSVSNNLFWYNDGEFENLPYTIEEGTIQLSPTERFLDVLGMLDAEDG